MNGAFHQILSQLRKKQRVSQRKVASDLYISQALLSHYENGIREPGLDFVNRACDYYDVSADFLLGRGDDTDAALASGAPVDAAAISALLHTVEASGNEAISKSLVQCFAAISYRLLRHMAEHDPSVDTSGLTVPENRAATLSELAFFQAEIQFLEALDGLSDQGSSETAERLASLLVNLDQQIAGQKETV